MTTETSPPNQDEPVAATFRTLFVTDAELIRRMGVPEKIARAALRHLDHQTGSGFPKKQALWGNRRYWPAVEAWLDRTNGVCR